MTIMLNVTNNVAEKHFKGSVILNGIVLLMEAYVLPNCYFAFVTTGTTSSAPGVLMFRFFTEDSNILLALSALLYLIFSIYAHRHQTQIPYGIRLFRYIAVTAVTTTFMVVLLFLAPYCGVAYGRLWLMWSWPNMLFTHFFCPVLSVLSFVFFEAKESDHPLWKEAFWVLSSVLLYAAIVGSLASLHLISSDQSVNNVYGFMDATAGPWWVTPLAFSLIVGGTYGEGVLLRYGQKKRIQNETK
jgi:hypothetical protein